jgi:hypothetical protein
MQFRSPDIQLASYLIVLGHPLAGVEGPPDRRVFAFTGVPDADIAAYYRGDRLVAPQPLFRAYRTLKRRLFE